MESTQSNPNAGLSVHQILAQGYLIYLAAIVVGFGASYVWPEITTMPDWGSWGMIGIIFGTLLVYWAQNASKRTAKNRSNPEVVGPHHFCVGPYKWTRSPTQYGLFLMALGLAVLYGSFYMVIATVVALLVGKFVIIRAEEKKLVERYGQPYLDYQKEVRF